MSSGFNRLSDRQVKAFRGPGKVADGGGLWLVAHTSGVISWKLFFTLNGSRREMGLGALKVVTLASARRLREANRELVQAGTDPIGERNRREKLRVEAENPTPALTFGEFADAYVEGLNRNPKTLNNWKRTIEVHFKPVLHLGLDQIGIDEVVSIIQPLMRAMPVSGEKALTYMRKILASAKVKGLRTGDNPAVWKDNIDQIILDKQKPLTARGHHLALPYGEMPGFMEGLRTRRGVSARALEFTILTTVRTTEVIQARRLEVDLTAKIWTIPGVRMKMDRDHRVALSDDAIDALGRLPGQHEPEPTDFLFPGQGVPHLDGMSMTRVLKRMGVKDRSTVHGFRSTFRDWVGEETDFDPVLAEIALAHKVGSDVEQAYKRGDMLTKRFVVMNKWADFCAGRA